MIPLKLNVLWIKYALAIGGVVLAIVAVRSCIYSDIYKDIELKEQGKELKEADAKLEQAEKDTQRQLSAISTKIEVSDAAQELRDQPRPSVALGDAGDEWLQHINDTVRAANVIAGADKASGASD